MGAACAALFTGCFGSFPVVRKVYDFNSTVENKIARTAVFWALMILPVYAAAGLADLWVFNLIEFWTSGGNPRVERLPDGRMIEAVRLSDGALRLRVLPAKGGAATELELVKVGDHAGFVRRPNGEVLVVGEALSDGTIAVRELRGASTCRF
jgi:hypothetical protein